MGVGHGDFGGFVLDGLVWHDLTSGRILQIDDIEEAEMYEDGETKKYKTDIEHLKKEKINQLLSLNEILVRKVYNLEKIIDTGKMNAQKMDAKKYANKSYSSAE